MSCTNYNSNTAPSVTFGGSVPSDSCFSTVPALFTLFKNSLVGSMPADYSTFLISDTEPSPSNRDKVWVYVDSATCRPIGIRLYLNGKWVDVGARYFYGVDTSIVANTITVTSTTPSVNWAETGQIYAIKAALANTGPATITIGNGTTNWFTSTPIKQYGSSALAGLEYLANQVLLLYYDGTNFQLLNPRPTSGGSSVTSTSLNLSFEDDTDGNGIPDQWNAYAANLSTTAFTGAGLSALSAPTGGTFTLDSSVSSGGGKSVKFTAVNGSGNGGGFIQNAGWIPCVSDSIIELSWYAKASAAGIWCYAEVLWYSIQSDSSGFLSKTTLWTDQTNGPNGYWYQIGGITKVPSLAKYYRIRLVGGTLNNTVSGTVWFDDVQLNAPKFTKKIQFTDSTVTNAWFTGATVIQAKVTCVGAGGPGGGGENSGAFQGGGGGGAGGTGVSYVPVNPLAAYNVVVGSGSNSTFNSTTVVGASGNAGAQSVSGSAPGGSGGTANTGDVTFTGESGRNGGTTSNTGYGGCSILGAGGAPNNDTPGQSGQIYGGGGGGSRKTVGGAVIAGGSGAKGTVVIEYN